MTLLITTNSEIKNYVSVSIALEYDTLKPYLKICERDYLKTLFGADLLARLLSGSGGSAGTDDSDLITLVKTAEVDIALWLWAKSVGTVNVSSAGIRRNETENLKTAYKYQEKAVIDSFKGNGLNGLDAILDYLESNIENYPEFENWDNYIVFKDTLVSRTAEFNKIYNIGSSRLVFLRMKQFLRKVEEIDILTLIGADLYDLILGEYQLNDFTGKNETLFKYLQKALIFKAVYKAITELNVNISDKGFHFVEQSGDSVYTKKTKLDTETLANLQKQAKTDFQSYFETVRQYLLSNLSDFPLYENSTAYNTTASPSPFYRDNDNKKTFWV
ncbi:MAG: DUF6712 family protein [Nanoarchaeota archaeon]|nr:DUF6712 family protein [Nanoarchaeota archaeon]